jgi:thioredoxin 1
MIKYINNLEEFNEAIASGKVLVDFFANWCGPCKMLAPVLDELEEEGSLEETLVIKVDVDKAPEIAGKFGIESIPTLMLFKDGQLVNHALGFMPKPMLVKFINK